MQEIKDQNKDSNIQIFLIIGLTKESAHWDDEFLESLKYEFGTTDIVLVDLPGSGKYLEERSPTSIQEIVQLTREKYFSKLNQKKRRLLISISLGGMIASEWSHRYPDDFEALVLMNSSFKNLSTLFKRVQPWAIKQFFSIFLTKDSSLRERKIIELCSNRKEKYDLTHKKWIEIGKTRTMKRQNMIRQTLAGMKFSVNFKPSQNILIIAAKYDRLAHYSCSYNIHKKWGSDFYLIEDEGVGHAIHIDDSLRTAQKIRNWFLAT